MERCVGARRNEIKDEMVEAWSAALKGLLSQFEATHDVVHEAEPEIDRIADRVCSAATASGTGSSASPDEASGCCHGAAVEVVEAPKPGLMVSLKNVREGATNQAKEVFMARLHDTFMPFVRQCGVSEVKDILNDTLALLFKYLAYRLSDLICTRTVEVISRTVFPEAKQHPEMKGLLSFLTLSVLNLIPTVIQGGNVRRESVSMAHKFVSEAAKMIARIHHSGKDQVSLKNVERLIDVRSHFQFINLNNFLRI